MLPAGLYSEMMAHCLRGLPEEACGLLGGHGDVAEVFYPAGNEARSARLYTVEPKAHLLADRDAEERGMAVVGVVHSHTHTEAYPSPIDVDQAVDPSWHYLIASFCRVMPSLRSYRIVGGAAEEEELRIVATMGGTGGLHG